MMYKLRIKLKVKAAKVVNIATKQNTVNKQLVADLSLQLELAKAGRINCLALLSYCPGVEQRWFSSITTAGVLTTTDCFVFTESMTRQVQAMRNLADDIRDEEEAR